MFFLFIRDVLSNHFEWLAGKKIIAYFLLQGDIIIILLGFTAYIQWRRWRRLNGR